MKKYFGSVNLDKIKDALEAVPYNRVNNGYGDELKADAVIFDDGNVGLSVYNKETGKRIYIGKFMPSKFQNKTTNEQSNSVW